MSDPTTYREDITASTPFNVLDFFFRQQQGKVRIATIVQVVACTNSGGLSPVGFVDVQPLVQQVDGAGKTVDLPVLYHVPYFRMQGGTNALILDPKKGDLGIAVFADRDVSKIKATKAKGAPGSNRRNDLADALYVGGILNGVPQQYVQFNDDGITMVSPQKITAQAPDIELVGDVHITGHQTNDQDIVAQGEVTGNNVSLSTHEQSGVTTGSGNSGAPVPGT